MNQFLRKAAFLVVLAGLIISGCAGNPTPEGTKMVPPTESTKAAPQKIALKSDKARIENPQVPEANLTVLENGNRAFALALYQQLTSQNGNLFYSPYSISLALAMTYAGARGDTETQMAQALHFELAQADLHPAFNALSQALADSSKNTEDQQGEPLTLNIANALWGQQGFSFQSDFLDTLAQNYGAGMQEVDFSNPEQARTKINDWVAEQTNQKIKDLIPDGVLNDITRLVLTNAIYFKANWQYPFEKTYTAKGDFTLLNGDKVQVDMMHESESLPYAKGSGYQALELPYAGETASMLVLLPDEGKFQEFERALSTRAINTIQANLEQNSVQLSLPKFKIEASFGLNQALSALGMTLAFDPNRADFSGMTGTPDLFISDVIQKAYVNVNEEGTEAAAATAVIMKLTSLPANPVIMNVDRPFIFLILDKQTDTILFMGRVLDPS
jgi:serpin B